MKKTGIGLVVGGLILSLFFAFGRKLPALERNLKTTKIAIDKVKELHDSRIGNEVKTGIENSYQNNDKDDFVKEENEYNEPLQNDYQDEANYSRIYKNSVRNHNDYVRDSNGKIYENKPCYNCSGEGYTIFINPESGQKETNICNACNGVGQIGYEF